MRSPVQPVLQSLLELSKKRVKRNASVWSSKIAELYSARSRILPEHVPVISRCFLANNLLHDPKVREILRDTSAQFIDGGGLPVEDYSLVSYVYSCIDEDAAAEALLSRNYSEDAVKSCSDHELLSFLKTVSLALSRSVFGEPRGGSQTAARASEDLLEFFWGRVKSINTQYKSESVEYLAFSELMLECIFISQLRGRLDRGVLSHEVLDYGSIFSLVRVAPLLSPARREALVARIEHADYGTVLDTLRLLAFFRLPEFEFAQHLFNRLCNTPAKSGMCRREALGFLDLALARIEASLAASAGDPGSLARLRHHLAAIRSSRALENPHRSRIRWNYPYFIA